MLDVLFNGEMLWFSVPATIGTLLFVARLGLMMLGHHGGAHSFGHGGGHFGGHFGGHGFGHGAGHGGGHVAASAAHGGGSGSTGHSKGVSMEWFSFQSLMAMLMGFGWGGIGAYKGSGLSMPASVAVGVVCGFASTAFLLLLLRNMRKLAASGNVPIDSLAGAEGDAASAVPANGQGRGEVRFVIDSRERRCWAISAAEAIASRTRVRVVAVNPDNTVTVRAI